MKHIIDNIRSSIENKNLYSALFVSLTLPDICVALEHGNSSGKKYSEWFGSNIAKYTEFLSGDDCYALRCSVLHQGIDNIDHQRMKDVLEHYVFLSEGPHLKLFKDCTFNGVKKSFLQLNVRNFCEDMCIASETWLANNVSNQAVQDRLAHILEIHDPGYTYMGLIKFV